jgi:F-type H+-transporting ATPase subunit gamma
MSDTLESLNRKREAAAELNAVVLTMKAMAASNIGQFEMAAAALKDYYKTITLGVRAWFYETGNNKIPAEKTQPRKSGRIGVIIFGTDQGLVGRFNDAIAEFAENNLRESKEEKFIWAAGDRVAARLSDLNLSPDKVYATPNSVNSITGLVDQILISLEEEREKNMLDSCYIFNNAPAIGADYEPGHQRLLPLDATWEKELVSRDWPTNNIPTVVGDRVAVLTALIREYLFVSIFKACAESLASENASRLRAMQRAEKNIGEMLDDLNQSYNRLRQSTIDEELFDVVSGFEALKNKN